MMTIALLVVLAAATDPAPPDSSPRPLTLAEAVAMAQRNDPQVIQARGEVRTSAAGVRSAWAAFLPSLSLSAGATRQVPSGGSRTRVENGQVVVLPAEPWSYNLGLGSSVELFSGGQRIFDLQRAKAQAEAAKVNEVTQRYAAALDVKQQFFNALAARESEAAAQAQLEQAEQQLNVSTLRLAARNVTRSDSLRAAIQVRSARLALLEARTSLEVAEASLTRLVGAPYPVTAAVGDLPGGGDLPLDDATLLRLAEAGPAVAHAQAALEAARAARRSAWTGYLPAVTTSYSRGGSGTGPGFVPPDGAFDYSGSVRLSLSLPVFNQLQREQQVVSARVAEDNAVAALRDARLAAREQFAQGLGTFRAAQERVASQGATVGAAEEDLRMQQERYGLGRSTLLDVLTSQTTLDQARRDLIRARYDERVARAQIEALVGRDL